MEVVEKSILYENIWIKERRLDCDFVSLAEKYYKLILDYVEQLEMRSQAPQPVLDKLVQDVKCLYDNGDCLNSKIIGLYSPENGYTIKNVSQNKNGNFEDYFTLKYLFKIVFGNGIPEFYIDVLTCNLIPEDLVVRLFEAYKTLEQKVVVALNKINYNSYLIERAVQRNQMNINKNIVQVELVDSANVLERLFIEIFIENKQQGFVFRKKVQE